MMLKNEIWKLLYSRWKRTQTPPNKGYTILLMVPGDLPAFMKIAVEQCAAQASENLSEVIVVPDNVPPGFMERFREAQRSWTKSPMRLALMNPAEYLVTRTMNNPHTNCWLQFITGCNQTHTRYLLWHDADLFIIRKSFLEDHFKECRDKGHAILGLNEAWDEWYRQNGYGHLVSTWEIITDLDWVRSFAPWQHRGHDGPVGGKMHTFDITFLPQCLTPPERIRRHEGDWGFVHFNYVIGTYRRFQNSKGPYEDTGFKVLFVRLLADAYDADGSYEAPAFDRLLDGFKDPSQRVTYLKPSTKDGYGEFRAKFQKLLDSGVVGRERETVLKERIERFDRAIGWKEMV